MNAVAYAVRVRARRARGSAALIGPAFVAAAAYVDPGNVATNVAAGSSLGYLLLWVVVIANSMAAMIQFLSAKLGLVTGMSLPEVLRRQLNVRGRLLFWGQAELVTMATDLAEVLGGAIALQLLFGLPLVWGGVLTAVVSMAVLQVRGVGERSFERVVVAMLAVVALGFMAGLFLSPPDPHAVVYGLLPGFAGGHSLVLAAGILGATVMPHAIYAHSALVRDRHGSPAPGRERRRLLRATRTDVVLALTVAGLVNLGLLALGASTLRSDGRSNRLEGVHAALGAQLGPVVATLFAVGLLFSGLASTAVGCYSGSVVMSGLLQVRIPLLLRRAVTAVPAVVVLAAGADPTWALIASQVVLSFGIPFALIPLLVLTSRRGVMGEDTNHPVTVVVGWAVAVAIVALNVALLVVTFGGS